MLAALLVATIGCSSPTAAGSANGTVEIRYGDTATVSGTRLFFSDIVDSRCPKDVVCAWAGDAAVRLESGSEAVVLHTNPGSGPATGTLAGMTLTLLDVEPEPVGSNPPKKSDYVATIRTSR